jgi:hypothetical protein
MAAPTIPSAGLQKIDDYRILCDAKKTVCIDLLCKKKGGGSMDNKYLYNRVMLIALCLILVLLCAGFYSYIKGSNDIDAPRGKAQIVRTVAGAPSAFLL